ncbi:hypothetical protein RU85_GL000175 [Lactococcus garvieae]|nr:hypothetical protein RU85_GL000175 [Lactococcus garvieae]
MSALLTFKFDSQARGYFCGLDRSKKLKWYKKKDKLYA